MAQTAVFRTDASVAIGGGHVMRCIALAEALEGQGWRCHFAGIPETPQTVRALGNSRFDFIALNNPTADATIDALVARLGSADAIIVDHYGLDARFEMKCRRMAKAVMVIDDLCNRDHDCDVLLDTGWDRKVSDYAGRAPPDTVFLLGPAYALLRPGFADARKRMRPRIDLKRILVAFGATDSEGFTKPVVEALLRHFDGAVDVVLGSGAPGLAGVRALAERDSRQITLHIDTDRMSDLILAADLAIGAGGTSTWERCCLGLPTLLIATAANQRDNARALTEQGAAVVLAQTDEVLPALRALTNDRPRLTAMSMAAAQMCDGLGAQRVATKLTERLQ